MKVINLKGMDPFKWSMEKNHWYIGRPSRAGNPFRIGQDGTRDQVIRKFAQYFNEKMRNDPEFRSYIFSMKDKEELGCWCKPNRCHGDIIASFFSLFPTENDYIRYIQGDTNEKNNAI